MHAYTVLHASVYVCVRFTGPCGRVMPARVQLSGAGGRGYEARGQEGTLSSKELGLSQPWR
jgi:hypothetical protein